MDRADERYNKLKEQLNYLNKNRATAVIVSKLETTTQLPKDVYFIYGISIN
jgi:hypothetical protein